MISQAIFDTSKVLSEKGIRHAVLSPGSRNAPLIISFSRNKDIRVYNIVDERSAGFIALGIAQKLNVPVALCCTSGTAMLNYGPAIAEAYYQQVPLLVLTADRPSEWIDQRDGQTINQPGALSNFVKQTYDMPLVTGQAETGWEYLRKLNEGINLSKIVPKGPVHFNIPFREPFYPSAEENLEFSSEPNVISVVQSNRTEIPSDLLESWESFDRRMLFIGQQLPEDALKVNFDAIGDKIPVLADCISNVSGKQVLRYQDTFLNGIDDKLGNAIRPDLLVTFGKSVISKKAKLFFRRFPPKEHWHFDPAMAHTDTFQALTKVIESDGHFFLDEISTTDPKADAFHKQIRHNFLQNWSQLNDRVRNEMATTLTSLPFSELTSYARVIDHLPDSIDLHLSNSMGVRYVNLLQGLKPTTEVYANRGTSGIDGTNGTAVGCALVSNRTTVLLTGDLSFFYDRNAFFHAYPMNNLKIVVFNNYGGGIFGLIPGPAALPELEQHFETRHSHSARFTAMEYGLDYFHAKDDSSLMKGLKGLFSSTDTPGLLEITSDTSINEDVFANFMKLLKTESR